MIYSIKKSENLLKEKAQRHPTDINEAWQL